MPSRLDPSWSTQEPRPLHLIEQLLFRGILVGCIAYGIHMAIFFTCIYFLFKRKQAWAYKLYVLFLFLLGTAMIACQSHFGELLWVDERNYPGGPMGFIVNEQNVVSNVVGDSVANTITLVVDAMLIYRCYIVWNLNIYVVILPVLMLLGSTATSILRTVSAAQPASNLFSKHVVKFGLAYWSLSLSLNILVTIIIASRLMMARSRLRKLMGEDHAQPYVGIASMIVESALPYAVFSLASLIAYEKGDSAQSVTDILISILPQVQCISPQIIIIRVSIGRGWSKDTLSATPVSKLQFHRTEDSDTTTERIPPGDLESNQDSGLVMNLTTSKTG